MPAELFGRDRTAADLDPVAKACDPCAGAVGEWWSGGSLRHTLPGRPAQESGTQGSPRGSNSLYNAASGQTIAILTKFGDSGTLQLGDELATQGIIASELPELIVKAPGEALRRLVLSGGEVTIGRSPECSVVLASPFVSRVHACLTRVGAEYHLLDSGSLNGLLFNGRKLSDGKRLTKGDVIRIGDVEMTYWESSAGDSTLEMEQAQQGRLIVDRQHRRLWVGEHSVDVRLTPQEFDLLGLLAQRPGSVVSYDEILAAVWSPAAEHADAFKDHNLVHRLVLRLRTKLRPLQPAMRISSVRGAGYRLDAA